MSEVTEDTLREEMGLRRRVVSNKTVEKPSLKQRLDDLEMRQRERASDLRFQRSIDRQVKALQDLEMGRRTLEEIRSTTTEAGLRSKMHLKPRRVD